MSPKKPRCNLTRHKKLERDEMVVEIYFLYTFFHLVINFKLLLSFFLKGKRANIRLSFLPLHISVGAKSSADFCSKKLCCKVDFIQFCARSPEMNENRQRFLHPVAKRALWKSTFTNMSQKI